MNVTIKTAKSPVGGCLTEVKIAFLTKNSLSHTDSLKEANRILNEEFKKARNRKYSRKKASKPATRKK